ncbi:unnamed protein product [Adineta steineri]|uniref:Uncharacterized protein n=1 Tax=Adineta steineri TaxID=433720 RepID=A0A819DMZ3_9BILA|nr:unnamed protein product [Adineta steineri]CAF3826802.1 unnamed protein product [Adineta steineri]
MWYPSQQQHHNQQQRWHGYNHHLSTQQQQQQQNYSRTSYYCNSDESLTTNQATTTYVVSRNDENESFIHYHQNRPDDVYATGTDYYVTTSTGSYSDEMSSSSLPYHSPNTHWNPVIAAPTKTFIMTNSTNQNHITNVTPSSSPTSSSSSPSSPSSSSSSACWDWLLYPPEIYSHLYIPSSSFIQQQPQDEDFDLLASLPTWLLALLYPSMKQIYTTDDENDSDQEISSLNNNYDEPLLSINVDKKINHVSSNLSLSSENTVSGQKLQQNRSSTPDTDDGYQSASDASRSDYSQQSSLHYDHHNSKDDITINVPSSLMPRRISYAAAVKPITTPIITNNKTSPLTTPIIKTKNNSSSSSSLITNDLLNNNGQKLKFIAPRFERMHHAKQYPSTTTTTTTTIHRDSSSSSSSTSLTNRTQIRSNNNNNNHNNQRNYVLNSTRRR